MTTIEEVRSAIEEAKVRLATATTSAALTECIDELTRLTCLLSLDEYPEVKTGMCVLAQAPQGAASTAAKDRAANYRHTTHIKAWTTSEPNELVIFPVDNADMIKVIDDLERLGYKFSFEKKEAD